MLLIDGHYHAISHCHYHTISKYVNDALNELVCRSNSSNILVEIVKNKYQNRVIKFY